MAEYNDLQLIYIAGDNRSGSTMLDMMLAGHTQITSIGEAHQLKAYVTEDTKYYEQTDGEKSHKMICYCGKRISKCDFWNSVEASLGRPLGDLDLKLFFLRSDLKGTSLYFMKKLSWVLINAMPNLYKNNLMQKVLGGERTAYDSVELFRAVHNVAKTRYVLDSSKNPHRMYSLYKILGSRMKVILLCRDYKGTIYSKMKRGVPMWKAALQWKWTVQQMEAYAQDMHQEDIIRLRYEDICTRTRDVMQQVCAFLGLQYEEALEKRNHEQLHHLGGSPSKYEKNNVIKLDTGYEKIFSMSERRILYRIVKREAQIWGYSP